MRDFFEYILIAHWIIPVACIAGGLFIGIIFDKIVLRRLASIAAKTSTGLDDAIITSLAGIITLFFLLGGIAIALRYLPLRAGREGRRHGIEGRADTFRHHLFGARRRWGYHPFWKKSTATDGKPKTDCVKNQKFSPFRLSITPSTAFTDITTLNEPLFSSFPV